MTFLHRNDPRPPLDAESQNAESQKPQLSADALAEVVQLALWVGQMQLRSGAQTARIESTVHSLTTALGAAWLDVLVLPEGLVLTTSSGAEFRTRVRRVTSLGVNLSQIDAIERLRQEVVRGQLDRSGLHQALERLSNEPPAYSRATVVLMVGLACSAFSQLFGGDWLTLLTTLVSSSAAMYVRQELHRRFFNPLLTVIATAFVAALIPNLFSLAGWLPAPEFALAASVLLLVPGVPLINAARDILRGYLVNGTARGVLGFVMALAIALGILLALQVSGQAELEPLQPLKRAWVPFLISDFLWSGIAALGFAILFNSPRSTLFACFLGGALGHALRETLLLVDLPAALATLFAAGAIGVFAELMAHRRGCPAGLFSVPAAIPMVPGVFAFRGMMAFINVAARPESNAVQQLYEGASNCIVTGLILAGLAAGIALPALLFRRTIPVI